MLKAAFRSMVRVLWQAGDLDRFEQACKKFYALETAHQNGDRIAADRFFVGCLGQSKELEAFYGAVENSLGQRLRKICNSLAASAFRNNGSSNFWSNAFILGQCCFFLCLHYATVANEIDTTANILASYDGSATSSQNTFEVLLKCQA